MVQHNRTLNDEFELKGIWFLPMSKDRQVSGSLKYYRGDIQLETIGLVEQVNQHFITLLKSSNQYPSNIPIILGTAPTGEKITLINSSRTTTSSSLTNLATGIYHSYEMVIGKHFEKYEDIKFKSIHSTYSNLNVWYGKSGIRMITSDLKNNVLKFEQTPVEVTNAKIDDDFSLKIQVLPTISKDITQSDLTIKETTSVSIVSQNLTPFKELDELNRCVRYFLMLGMMHTVHPLTIVGYINDEKIEMYPNYRLYDNIPKIVVSNDMLFTYHVISNNFESFIQSWRKLWLQYKDTIINYFSTLLDEHLTIIELQFQSIALALESYHREKFPDTSSSDEEYNKMIQGMISKVKDDPKQVRYIKRFKAMGNDPSLSERLHELVKICPDMFKNSDEEKTEFVDKVSSTRNYFSHGSKELKEKAITNFNELFYIIQEMKILMEGCFLSELPFSQEKLQELIVKNRVVKNYAKEHSS